MPQSVWKRKFPSGYGLEKALAATRSSGQPEPIESPPSEVSDLLDADVGGNGFTLASWTASDAWELGHLLHARLSSWGSSRPALISISLASGLVLFQSATGSGLTPDNGVWVARKRKTVLRFGVSSWLVGRKFGGDEGAFAAKYGLSPDQASEYAIHGGGVPIRVAGVEGVVAVVVVSGLKQNEDHGVISEVIRKNWTTE
ncbi:DUF967 domain protein [Drechmeria coniospora]|uniref:DUF967 domain protein n=1 Tax=Drechmeria coniospora TaxID=98403 RepID=A0A151GVT0_DRECN|nr:DUF967 domain protein [Drechmeria coniospora]KYK61132.1 DUF967 domain protein [Drechmeria coniospora]